MIIARTDFQGHKVQLIRFESTGEFQVRIWNQRKACWSVNAPDTINFVKAMGTYGAKVNEIIEVCKFPKPTQKPYKRRPIPSKPRDSQRSKVYAAEGLAFREHEDPNISEPLEKDALQEFADEIISSNWWEKNTDIEDVEIEFSNKRTRTCMAFDAKKVKGRRVGRISMSTQYWAMRRWVIVHELAHIVTDASKRNLAGHGKEYCKVYLSMVREFFGWDAYCELKARFLNGKVSYA